MSWYDPRDWDASGMASGAGIGFMVGGPAGAAIGAGLGGALSGSGGGNRAENAEKVYGGIDRNNFNVPGYEKSFGQYGNMADQFGGRRAPQAGQSVFRQQQMQLGHQLGQEARGNGIGQQLIRAQAQGMADRGMQQQIAQAASARPGQSALATRQAMMNSGNMNAQVGGQSAQAAGQYQLGAMNNYGQFLGAARGQDDQMSQFNTDARLRQLGLNDQAQLEALRQRLALQQSQQQGGMGYEGQRTQRYGALIGQPTSQEQMMSGLMGLGTAYLGSKG